MSEGIITSIIGAVVSLLVAYATLHVQIRKDREKSTEEIKELLDTHREEYLGKISDVKDDIQNGDILVLSFDGVNEIAINYCLEGTIACIVECNPLHGPRVENIIQTLKRGGTPDKLEYVSETLYSSFGSVTDVRIDSRDYPVTLLTQEVIDTRAY